MLLAWAVVSAVLAGSPGVAGAQVNGSVGAAASGPPATEARPVMEVYHGEEVVDPYRWLEGTGPEVRAWTESQNAHTRGVLDGLGTRARLEARMRALIEVGEIGLPRQAGSRAFYTKRTGAQPQAALLVRRDGESTARTLLDPFALDQTGLTSIDWFEPSPDGSVVAVGLSRGGDEDSTLHLIEVESGAWLADEIPGKTRLSGWLEDGRSFFYSRLEDVSDPYSRAIAYHEIGRSWRTDPVVLRQRDVGSIYAGMGKSAQELESLATTWGPTLEVGRDGRWLVLGYWTSTSSNDLWLADLGAWRRTGELERRPLIVGESGRNTAIATADAVYVQTSVGAPGGRVVRIDAHDPSRERWREVVTASGESVLLGFGLGRGVIVAEFLREASTSVELFGLDGRGLGPVELPGIGSASVSATEDRSEAFVSFESFARAPVVYRVNLSSPKGGLEVWDRITATVEGPPIEVTRATFASKDGTPVGMFIVHRQGLELNGRNPTLLHGYGGFAISKVPEFDPTVIPWLERGGVYAVANLRGGGEKGLAWHRAGVLDRKQSVFDDFIAAGEHLIARGYTSAERLGIEGRSNGGLLVGAAVTQRPDLFAAAVCGVPLLDMLRYERFLMARFWVPEYGSAAEEEDYRWLRAYSPYQNVRAGTKYPAVLLHAGENDTRVHPLHARKMAARLQAATTGDPREDPVLLWVDADGGHGAGKPLSARVREAVDRRIFMMWQLGMLESGG